MDGQVKAKERKEEWVKEGVAQKKGEQMIERWKEGMMDRDR